MKLSISYNPYLLESHFWVDGANADKTSWAQYLSKRRMQTWFYPASNWKGFAVAIQDALNESEIEIDFTGRAVDYQDLKLFCDEWNEHSENKGKRTTYKLLEQTKFFQDDENVLKELDKLVATFPTSPVEALRNPELQKRYKQARSADFDMAVIATMSSGKSTLINALLGCDLLPAANDATTAKITRIKDLDGVNEFTVECRDQNEDLLHKKCTATLELLNQYNNEAGVFYVDVEGDIPEISGKNLRLNILDTPGPNNSATGEHRRVTNTVLHDGERQPIILYVMDCAKPEAESDANLLDDIAEAIRHGGKQAQERFVFVMNRADVLRDKTDGTIRDVIKRRQEYLNNHGIYGTQIIPISAMAAKLLRMQNSQLPLEEDDEADLSALKRKLIKKGLDEAALLSPSCKDKLAKMKEKAKAQNNQYLLNLIASGIVGLELTINEYLEKYAYPYKINQIIETFSKKLNEIQMHANFADQIANDKKQLEQTEKALNEITAKKNELEKKRERLKDQINEIVFDDAPLKDVENVFNHNIEKSFASLRSRVEIPEKEKEIFLNEVEQVQKKLIHETKQILKQEIDEQIKNSFGPIYCDCRELMQQFEDFHIPNIDFEKIEGMIDLDCQLEEMARSDLYGIMNSGKYVYEKSHIEIASQKNEERKGFFGFFKFWKGPRHQNVNVTVSDGRYIKVNELFSKISNNMYTDFDQQVQQLKKSCCVLYQSKQQECKTVLDCLKAVIDQEIQNIIFTTQQVKNKRIDINANEQCLNWINVCQRELNNLFQGGQDNGL